MDFELTDEQRMLKQMVRDLAEKEFRAKAREWDEREEVPWENIRRLGDLGILGVALSKEHGGGGGTVFDAVLAIEEVARACGNTAVSIITTSLGPPRAVDHFGTEEQKSRFIPGSARGESLAAIAITEPEAGSDVTSMRTTAVRHGDGYIINGVKHFTSWAGVAGLYMVYARFGPSQGAKGIGAILVEGGTPGLTFGKQERLMGLRGVPHCETIFTNCWVPKENVLVEGDPENTEGFKKLMAAVNQERCGNPACCLGLAQGAFDLALKYIQERQQFGRPIADFQGIQWMLADMAIKLDAGRLLLYKAAARASTGMPAILDSSIAKTYVNEMALDVINVAIQLHGGYGVAREFQLERMWRDARGFSFGAGTTQIQRNMIASQLLRGMRT